MKSGAKAGTSGNGEYIVIPPDGGWGWVVVVASFFINLICDGIIYAFAAFIPHLEKAFNAPIAEVSLAGSLLAGILLFVGPFAGALTNWLGFRIVVFLGAATAAGGFLAAYNTKNIHMFQLCFGLIGGIGFGLIYTPAIVVVGFYFEKYRGAATGLAVCGSGAGAFVLAPLTNYLIHDLGWKNMLLINTAFISSCAIIGLVFRPVPPTRLSQVNIDTNEEKLSKISKQLKDQGKKNPTAAEVVVLKQADRAGLDRKGSRPLYRDDIFYTQSLRKLPTYDKRDRLYSLSVIRLHPEKRGRCRCCMTILETLESMLNLSLLKSPTFFLLAIEGFLAMTGFYVPYMYVPERAIAEGIQPKMAYILISTMGITNTFGRAVSGAITSVTNITALWVTNISTLIAGVATIVSGLNMTYEVQIAYAIVYGGFIAGFICLRAVLVAEYMGLENLTNGFGLLLLFQGVGACIGPPLAGLLVDEKTHNYDYAFYFSGGLLVFAALLCFPLDLIYAWEKRKTN